MLLGHQGITPAFGMSSNFNGQSFENINLRAKSLPVENIKGGQSATGVNIKSDNVNVMKTNIFYRLAELEDSSKLTGKKI